MNKHKNEVHLAGELARDPETRFTTTGKQVTTLTVVTKYQQHSEYHRVVSWESLAEKAAELRQGAFIRLVGRLQTRSWQDQQTSQKKYLTEVVAITINPEPEPQQKPLTPSYPNQHGVAVTSEDIPF